MTILLLLVCLTYGIPIIVTLSSIIRLYIQNRTNSLLLLVLFVLAFSVWLFSSLPWQLDLNVKVEVVQSLFKIGIIFASLGLIILMMLFSRSFISNKVKLLAKIAIVIYLIFIGVIVASLIETNNEFYNLIREGDKWKAAYHPFLVYFINLGHVFYLTAFILGVRDMNTLPEHLMEPRNKKINNLLAYTFVITIITNSLFFVLDPVYGLISRYIFIFIILFIAYYLAHEPIMVFFDISNPRKIIEEGYIGYSFSALTQLGPSPIYYSDKFNSRFDIKAPELVTNSILSLTVINASHELTETIITIPFAKKLDIVSLNISFTMYDSTFDDPRHDYMNICVISILIPYFRASLRNAEKIQSIVRTETKKVSDLSNFTEEMLVKIVIKIVKELKF